LPMSVQLLDRCVVPTQPNSVNGRLKVGKCSKHVLN
jgi:hypothetical protein